MNELDNAADFERHWHGRLGREHRRCVVGILIENELVKYRHVYLRELGSTLVAVRACPKLLFRARGAAADQMADVDALLVPGGRDMDPALYHGHELHADINRPFDDFELTAVRLAFQRRMPLLAICRGHEVMNVAAGGTLLDDIAHDRPGSLDHCPTLQLRRRDLRRYSVHPITIEPGSRLEAILATREAVVNSLHHQCLGEIGAGLKVVARAPDGVPEALERIDSPWQLGLQFHPEWERLQDSNFARFFDALAHDGSLYAAIRSVRARESASDPAPA